MHKNIIVTSISWSDNMPIRQAEWSSQVGVILNVSKVTLGTAKAEETKLGLGKQRRKPRRLESE